MDAKEGRRRWPEIFVTSTMLKLCVGCRKQFGIKTNDLLISRGWEVANGVCDRHAVEAMRHAGRSEGEILDAMLSWKQSLAEKNLKGTKDLRNVPPVLIQWLLNPTPPIK